MGCVDDVQKGCGLSHARGFGDQAVSESTLDERVQHNIKANQATLAAAQSDADRAQGFADHFTAQREAQADNSAYGKHCQQISEAWQQVAA